MSHFDEPPPLRFPELYIQNDGVAYNLAIVPSEIFGAWLGQLVAVEKAAVIAANTWGIQEKWRALNELAEHGIEMQKYLYDGIAAARSALETQEVEAVHA